MGDVEARPAAGTPRCVAGAGARRVEEFAGVRRSRSLAARAGARPLGASASRHRVLLVVMMANCGRGTIAAPFKLARSARRGRVGACGTAAPAPRPRSRCWPAARMRDAARRLPRRGRRAAQVRAARRGRVRAPRARACGARAGGAARCAASAGGCAWVRAGRQPGAGRCVGVGAVLRWLCGGASRVRGVRRAAAWSWRRAGGWWWVGGARGVVVGWVGVCGRAGGGAGRVVRSAGARGPVGRRAVGVAAGGGSVGCLRLAAAGAGRGRACACAAARPGCVRGGRGVSSARAAWCRGARVGAVRRGLGRGWRCVWRRVVRAARAGCAPGGARCRCARGRRCVALVIAGSAACGAPRAVGGRFGGRGRRRARCPARGGGRGWRARRRPRAGAVGAGRYRAGAARASGGPAWRCAGRRGARVRAAGGGLVACVRALCWWRRRPCRRPRVRSRRPGVPPAAAVRGRAACVVRWACVSRRRVGRRARARRRRARAGSPRPRSGRGRAWGVCGGGRARRGALRSTVGWFRAVRCGAPVVPARGRAGVPRPRARARSACGARRWAGWGVPGAAAVRRVAGDAVPRGAGGG